MIHSRKKKYSNAACFFVLPSVILFGVFVCYPVLQTIFLSFTNWDGIGAVEFNGLDNYMKFFQDPLVRKAIMNNLLWMAANCTVPLFIGLFQASLLVNSGISHGKIFQLILFLPQIFSSVVATVTWTWIYNSATGPLNEFLKTIGLGKYAAAWIGNPDTVMFALLVMAIWLGYGFNTVVFTAAMQGIDTSLYEAAILDGCGSVKKFIYITLPGVRSTMTTLLLFALIGSFQVFDIVYQMTKGGPGYSSYVLSYHLYNEAFMNNHVGYGATIAVITSILILTVSKLFLWSREKGE